MILCQRCNQRPPDPDGSLFCQSCREIRAGIPPEPIEPIEPIDEWEYHTRQRPRPGRKRRAAAARRWRMRYGRQYDVLMPNSVLAYWIGVTPRRFKQAMTNWKESVHLEPCPDDDHCYQWRTT